MRYFVIILLLTAALVSCEKTLDVNLPDTNRKIVLNSLFSNDTVLIVNISKSRSVLDPSSIIFIDNANIKLYEDGAFIQELEYYQGGYYYADSLIPKANSNYKVVVKVPDLQDAEAENTLPSINTIQSIDTNTITVNDEYYSERRLECKLEISDPVEENYYMLEIYRMTESYYSTKMEQSPVWFQSNDPIFRDSIPNGSGGVIFKDDYFNGKRFYVTVQINEWDLYEYESDSLDLYFKLSMINPEYYFYMKSYNLYENTNGNPFAEPVQVYSNVKNGLGIFSGLSSNVKKLRVPVNEYEYKKTK